MLRDLIELLVEGIVREVANNVTVWRTKRRKGLLQCSLASGKSNNGGAMRSKTMDKTAAQAVSAAGDKSGVSREVKQILFGSHYGPFVAD
jgi:hypothetical protein